MLAATARRLVRASLLTPSALETYYKSSTGLVGLAVNPNAREDLIAQSKQLIEKVKVLPEDAEYRKVITSIANYRIKKATEITDPEKLEEELDDGQLEEILAQGKEELKLADDYIGMPIAAAEEKKNLGNQAFKAGNYQKAIEHYSQAIAIDPKTQTYWSNRSASYAGLGDWENAANDAAECVKVDRNFIKGYFRLALAQKNLGRYDAASETIKMGQKIDLQNADLKGMQKEIDEIQRRDKVAAFLDSARQQADGRDYAAALRSIENGLRLDAGNKDLVNLKSRVQPIFEREEKARKASLNPVERMKEEGDELYKAAKFEDAIKKYTATLDRITDKSSELALKVYANRSACYKQLSDFDAVIADTTSVLEVRPDDVKALLRRAQAFEAVERYKMALQDVRQLLSLPREQIGEQNVTIANGLQHRLNRVIQKLREG